MKLPVQAAVTHLHVCSARSGVCEDESERRPCFQLTFHTWHLNSLMYTVAHCDRVHIISVSYFVVGKFRF